MRATLSAFASGLLFGLGLIVSEMVDPAKVVGFLDVFGDWDPSLAFVLAGAVVTAAFGYRLAKRRRPLLEARFEIPTRLDLDARLLGGAALFGVGWGMAGFCPGPALVAFSFGPGHVLLFLAAMLAGMILFRLMPAARRGRAGAGPLCEADA